MSDEFTAGGCNPSDCASCGGGCSSAGGCDPVENHKTITLTMEDDTEVECAILTVFPVDAKEYIALLPLDENGQNESGEVYLYAFARTESGEPMLSNIESDEEYAKAAVAFDTVLQNAKDSDQRTIIAIPVFYGIAIIILPKCYCSLRSQ